jgi:hypothetical protein
MQQRLAVASVLLLVLLAGTSAVLIQSHVYGQSKPNVASQSQATHSVSTASTSTTSTNSTSPGGLLTTGNHNQTSYGDDGNHTEHETETGLGNSTMDS